MEILMIITAVFYTTTAQSVKSHETTPARAFSNKLLDIISKMNVSYSHYVHGFNTGNSSEIAAVYTKDCLALKRMHTVISGNKDLLQSMNFWLKGKAKRLEINSLSILPMEDFTCNQHLQYVSEWGNYRYFDSKDNLIQTGNYMCIWRIESNGNTKLHWDIYNEKEEFV